jgi:hypothetical protein
MAVAYSIFVIGLRIAIGDELFVALGHSVTTVIVSYFAAGMIAGVLFGIFRPLADHVMGAAVLGFIVAFGIYLPVAFTAGHHQSLLSLVNDVGHLALFMGPLGGVTLWFVNRART